MKVPTDESLWLILEEVGSTNDFAIEQLQGAAKTELIVAAHQIAGRGRFDRRWISGQGSSLAATWIAREYADHPQPWLVGMAVATAAAGSLHCQLQWPNDLMLEGKKLGGILTEVIADPAGRRVPLIGIGVNVNRQEFPPDIADKAISLAEHRPGAYDPLQLMRDVLARMAMLPEPDSWQVLSKIWALFDTTPGKKYRLQSGEAAVGIGIGPEGELLCAVDGETRSVMAAEAILGS